MEGFSLSKRHIFILFRYRLASSLHNSWVERERCGLVLDFQIALIDPHRDIFPSQTALAIKAPMLEADEAMSINLTGELGSIQGPREYLFGKGPAQDTTQHCFWAVPPVLAFTVGVMRLSIVVVPPRLMCPLDLWPGARIGEGAVREPPLLKKSLPNWLR
jgi:hypothetical protein